MEEKQILLDLEDTSNTFTPYSKKVHQDTTRKQRLSETKRKKAFSIKIINFFFTIKPSLKKK